MKLNVNVVDDYIVLQYKGLNIIKTNILIGVENV